MKETDDDQDKGRPADAAAPAVLYDYAIGRLLCGFSRTRLEGLLSSGEVHAVRVGRRTLVVAQSLREFIDRLPAARCPVIVAASSESFVGKVELDSSGCASAVYELPVRKTRCLRTWRDFVIKSLQRVAPPRYPKIEYRQVILFWDVYNPLVLGAPVA